MAHDQAEDGVLVDVALGAVDLHEEPDAIDIIPALPRDQDRHCSRCILWLMDTVREAALMG